MKIENCELKILKYTMKKLSKQQLEINKLQQEISDLKAGWQRTQADFENYRNRTARERLELIQSANRDLIEQILPVLDNFDIALTHKPKDLENNEYIKGLEYTKIQLEQILSRSGLEKIPVKIGDQFDPTIHEAVEAIEDKKLKKDQIAQIVSSGYKLNNALIRPAKVKVAK
jgi:molecular chaperone GrpE